MRIQLTICSILATLALGSSASAKEMTADEVVKKTNEVSYYQGKDGRATVTMTIFDKSGSTRLRQFTVLRRNATNGTADQSFYVYFHKPADVSKMVLIAKKHISGEDDRWLYLPGLDLVKRIAASDERTSFVGSDWFYEDVSGRSTNADTHRLVETTQSYYVLEHKPKKPKRAEFSSYKMWVHKGSFLPTKVEYYNKKGKKYRVMTVDSVKTVQGYKTVMKATMSNLDAGTKTVVTYSNVKYGIGFPEKLFTERYLRRAPQKYLK